MGPEGGQQRGDDGDDEFADAAKQLLRTVLHVSLDVVDSPPALPVRYGAVTCKIGI